MIGNLIPGRFLHKYISMIWFKMGHESGRACNEVLKSGLGSNWSWNCPGFIWTGPPLIISKNFRWSTLHSLTMAVSERLITEKSFRSRTRVQACPPASCSLGKFTLKLNAMIIEPLLPPIQAPNTKTVVSLKGESRTTVNPAPDHAGSWLPAQRSSLKPNMVLSSGH